MVGGPTTGGLGARVEATHLAADVVDGCGDCWRRSDITLKKLPAPVLGRVTGRGGEVLSGRPGLIAITRLRGGDGLRT